MAYIISDEAKDLLADVKKFCDKEVRQQCKEYDISGEFPKEIYDKALEIGLSAIEVPQQYGGLGLDHITCAALFEEMAKADAGFYTTMSASFLALTPVLLVGTEEQKKWACNKLVEGGYASFGLTEPMAGSDASNVKTTAVKDGDDYILNGRKCFITNAPVADFYVIIASTNKSKGVAGLSAFLVPKGTKGLSTGKHENKMGIRTSITSDVIMEDMRIPQSARLGREGTGFITAMKTLDMSRAYVGCGAVGIAQRALEEAVEYSKTRVTFGKPICQHEAIQFMIADMDIKTETARQMVAHALTLQQNGKPFSRESAIAKCYAGDIAVEVALDAIQILGGYGYSKEYPVEKLLRDAKIFQIYEGTNQIQRAVIAKAAMRMRK
ncbi:MAG: acyl-CoA dehydrogenase family protein [Clostridia bacterium]|jgi:butyryl-CoA dehydrogenase|nr:acyl-CoA dehydrogenase family protein [Clostridia bacterium]MCI2001098.1 acyl-CoA dehydrogenase family protein [Clostridia bacterium]MCI2015776.1 acyl-CoA dehydrogenase family protein [Clostridia bacterium]